MKEMSGEAQNQGSVHYVGLCIDLQGKYKWGMEVLDDQQFTAKIRDELLGCNICGNTSFSPQLIRKDKE
jgi:hypothetical protein